MCLALPVRVVELKDGDSAIVDLGGVRKQVSLAIDYGLPLAGADGEASDRGNSKWHLDLIYRY